MTTAEIVKIAVKVGVSATLIVLVNEVVIRYAKPVLGSLIASLPLVSIITFFWIYYGAESTAERTEKLATHSTGVFWFVLPSLPMFLILPWLLRKGVHFWLTLAICCVVTMALYALTASILKRFGMEL